MKASKSYYTNSNQRNKSQFRNSPSRGLFNELIDKAKSLKELIDTSKTMEEINLTKKMEKELEFQSREGQDTRMNALQE